MIHTRHDWAIAITHLPFLCSFRAQGPRQWGLVVPLTAATVTIRCWYPDIGTACIKVQVVGSRYKHGQYTIYISVIVGLTWFAIYIYTSTSIMAVFKSTTGAASSWFAFDAFKSNFAKTWRILSGRGDGSSAVSLFKLKSNILFASAPLCPHIQSLSDYHYSTLMLDLCLLVDLILLKLLL